MMTKEPAKEPTTNIERLDAFLQQYQLHPTDVKFEDFGAWYDFLKAEKLLVPITKERVEELRQIYNNDNQKCRCACVQLTLDGYTKASWTFKLTMEARNRLA